MSEKKNFEIGQQWRCRDGGRAVINAALCENDLYVLKGSVDPMAVCQNMLCEIEKVMGIYPNVSEQNK